MTNGLSIAEWKEEFVRLLAEELEDVNLAYISDDRVSEYIEMYGDTKEAVKDAAELEKASIEEVINNAKDDMGEDEDEDEEEEDEDDDMQEFADDDDGFGHASDEDDAQEP